jgi:hypothetical protein
MNVPSAALVFTGILLVAIGLFVAGNMLIVVVGIVAMIAAGVLQVLATRRV